MKQRAAALVIAALALAFGAASTASATVLHYTGCLTDKGVIISLQAGETPLFPCGDKATPIQLSSGDITKVDAGTGLQGGGVNGDVALAVAPSYRLPQSCATDQLAKWSGAAWLCANDSNNTYSGNDFALSNQSCSTGQVVNQIGATGTIGCVADQNTTYSGNDFALSNQSCPSGKVANEIGSTGTLGCVDDQNTTYSGANFALSNQNCSSGQFAKGVSTNGNLSCDTPPSGGASLDRYEATAGPPCCGVPIHKFADGRNSLVSVTPGVAGTYFIVARGVFQNEASALIGDNSRVTNCQLNANGTQDEIFASLNGSFWSTEVSVQGFATLSGSNTASMDCYVSGDPSSVEAYRLKIDAIRIG